MPPDRDLDFAIGAGALTTPLWLSVLNAALQEVMLIGGAILVLVRLWSLARRWGGGS